MNNKPWENIQATKEDIKLLWEKLDEIKKTAEQYIFPVLLSIDIKYAPLYNDLATNWDDYHAKLFVYGLTNELKMHHLM